LRCGKLKRRPTPPQNLTFSACNLRVTQLVDGNKGIHAMVERGLVQ
jgi:hypothetical protein